MPELVNEVVCAKLLDREQDPISKLIAMVTSQMSHGLCGLEDNPKAPYIVHKTPTALLACQKRFPKAFTAITIVREDEYPEYQRQDNSQTFTVHKPGSPGQKVVYNNYQVIPYNPYLLQKFRSYINIEVCASI